jgi:hypothetical protein
LRSRCSAAPALWVLALRHRQPVAFSARQIQLVETFADHAVIAIDNARLLGEPREVIGQQGTAGEILRAIANSPNVAKGVLGSIAERWREPSSRIAATSSDGESKSPMACLVQVAKAKARGNYSSPPHGDHLS